MRKSHMAQIQMAPLYILGGIIVVLIFIFGYQAISGFKKQEAQLTSFSMTAKLKNDIKAISSEFGTVKRIDYGVPNDISQVCISDKKNFPLACDEQCTGSTNKIADAFIKDNQNKNIFFFGTSTIKGTDYIDKVSIGCCEFACFKNTNNKITLMMEGLGDKALIRN